MSVIQEHLPKLFQRFYQVDSSYTRKVGGSGLGLSICKELVIAMGGTINIASTVGKGTMFFINLPVTRKKLENKDMGRNEQRKID